MELGIVEALCISLLPVAGWGCAIRPIQRYHLGSSLQASQTRFPFVIDHFVVIVMLFNVIFCAGWIRFDARALIPLPDRSCVFIIALYIK